MKKICTKCNQEKDLSFFNKDKNGKLETSSKCKECFKIYNQKYNKENKEVSQKYYQNNKEKIHQKTKEYYQNNKEKYLQKCKEYRLKNPQIPNYTEKSKKYVKNYIKKRRFVDPQYKLRISLGTKLINVLKNKNIKKTLSSRKLIGCTLDFLKEYLEQKFLPEMNWSNHGQIWEIDHIIPCSKFDLIKLEEQEKCFHYTNLQPLFKTTSIAKKFGYNNIIGNRNKSNKIL